MPAVVPFIPAIVGGLGAGATVYGSHAQASAQNKAQTAQAKAAADALAFQQKSTADALAAEKTASDRAYQLQVDQRNFDREAQRLAREDYLKRESPYIQLGNSAFGRLSQLLNVQAGPIGSPGSAPVAPQAPTAGARPMQMPVTTGVPAPPPGGQLARPAVQAKVGAGSPSPAVMGVQMLAPTGEIGTVPYDKVGAAIAAGARRVN